MSEVIPDEAIEANSRYVDTSEEDPWVGPTNPLGCCVHYKTPGGVPTHGGPDCVWPAGTLR